MSDDWRVMRARSERFLATELGQLYHAYDQATFNYWRRDADDSVSNKRLKELDQIACEATNAFVAKLMELAGVA
jgi:hypothetical protein